MTLPNFIVGGASKAGTTSLYHYLAKHPDIYMCPTKEPDFFNKHYGRGLEWYASLFDGHDGQAAIGEASPGTLSSPVALDRIYEVAPGMRFVFLLRDPVARLFSHFHFDQSRGVIPYHIPFGAFVRDEADAHARRLVERGLYADQIERFAGRFGREALHLALYDDLVADRDGCVASVCRFLGVDPGRLPAVATEGRHNVTAHPRAPGLYRALRAVWDPLRGFLDGPALQALKPVRSAVRDRLVTKDRTARPTIAEADRAYLAEVYEDSTARLESILGRDLSHWTRA